MTYLTAKEIWQITGIKPRSLRHARDKEYLTDIKRSAGGKFVYYSLPEVRKIFPNAK